jgi:hypothetical protein
MRNFRALLTLVLTVAATSFAFAREVTFEKRVLTSEYWCDGVNAADIDRDGHLDVIAGPFWYAGPSFKERHAFYEPVPQPIEVSPSNSMFSFPYDLNGDGWTDILVLGRVLFHQAFWYENPGKAGLATADARWKKHFVAPRVFGESPTFEDADGDGKPELLALSGTVVEDKFKQWGWYAPDWSDPTKPWRFVPITEKADFTHYYHGQGFGDIDGDGRKDLVVTDGWWSPPPKGAPAGTLWTPHPFKFGTGRGGAQTLVFDINGDGKNDVVNALDSHGWGLSWFEQTRDAQGTISFTEHRMMGTEAEEKTFGVAFGDPHALAAADIDGDGQLDVIAGQRRRESDVKAKPGEARKPLNYWFGFPRDGKGGATSTPHLIDNASGLGVQITVTDVNKDGVPDVLTASKLGVFVFLTQRK